MAVNVTEAMFASDGVPTFGMEFRASLSVSCPSSALPCSR